MAVSGYDELDDLERTYRRRKAIGLVLAVVVVAGSGLAAWMYLLREPSPASVCRSLYGLVEDAAEDEAAASLARRIAPNALGADDPEADFRETCEVYFGPLKGQREYPRAARCITTSWSAEAAQKCFTPRFYTDGASEAVREHLASKPVTFPQRAPELPDGLDEAYAALTEVSLAVLAKCDALYDVEKGCYVYTWAGEIEQRRELAQPIPGPVPEPSSGLVLLEASCSFDAAKWIERYPELREQLAATPLPVQWLSCDFLPVGDLRESVGCGSSSKPAPGRSSVGDPDRAGAEVWIPYDEECEGRWTRIELAREDGEGRRVELSAYFRGPSWEPLPEEPAESEVAPEP